MPITTCPLPDTWPPSLSHHKESHQVIFNLLFVSRYSVDAVQKCEREVPTLISVWEVEIGILLPYDNLNIQCIYSYNSIKYCSNNEANNRQSTNFLWPRWNEKDFRILGTLQWEIQSKSFTACALVLSYSCQVIPALVLVLPILGPGYFFALAMSSPALGMVLLSKHPIGHQLQYSNIIYI